MKAAVANGWLNETAEVFGDNISIITLNRKRHLLQHHFPCTFANYSKLNFSSNQIHQQ